MEPADALDLVLASGWGPVLAGLWGALWGSFLNVVIVRLPRGESLVRPGSHCGGCGAPVRFYDNVPIVSYLLLRGRCRDCGARFSPRYLLVEVLGVVLGILCFYHAVRGGSGRAPMLVAQFLAEFAFCATLLAVAFVDLDTMIIPHAITVPMTLVLTALAVILHRLAWLEALLGAVLGFGSLWLVGVAYRVLRGHEGMGGGDCVLLGLMGGFLGWIALPFIVFLASAQGLLVALPLLLTGRSLLARRAYHGLTDAPPGASHVAPDEEPGPGDAVPPEAPPDLSDVPARAVPFGPFLALAGVEVMLLGEWLRSWMLAWMLG
jgi:leader peptidase (prepilin peptidase)/N-methyltransferase